jgi:hypothetical protein
MSAYKSGNQASQLRKNIALRPFLWFVEREVCHKTRALPAYLELLAVGKEWHQKLYRTRAQLLTALKAKSLVF